MVATMSPQYRDLTQGLPKNATWVSKKRQALIDREKWVIVKQVCEFCETPYNESKTDECYQCDCKREGRSHPYLPTLRETTTDLRSVGLTERD